MTARYLAAFLAFGILTVFLPMPAIGQVSKAVELAGADEEGNGVPGPLQLVLRQSVPQDLRQPCPREEPGRVQGEGGLLVAVRFAGEA